MLCACYCEEPIVSSVVEELCAPAKPCSLETEEEEGQEGERERQIEREREAKRVLINNWSC